MSRANTPFRMFSLAACLVAAVLLLNIPVDGAPLSAPTSRPQSSTRTRLGATPVSGTRGGQRTRTSSATGAIHTTTGTRLRTAPASGTRGGSRTRTSSAAGAIHTTTANATTTNVACTPANHHGSKGRGRALDSRCAAPDESDPAFAFYANQNKCPDVKQVQQYITLWIQQFKEKEDVDNVVIIYWTFPTTQDDAEGFSANFSKEEDEEHDVSVLAIHYGTIMEEDREFREAWHRACGTQVYKETDAVKVASEALALATPGEAIFLIDSSKKETPDGHGSIEWEETELPILRRKRTKIIVHDIATKREVTWDEYERQNAH